MYDKKPLLIGDISVLHCDTYVYLGSIFTSDGCIRTALAQHAKEMNKQLCKLVMFMNTNKDMPFVVKRKVVDAAFNACILYGSESWLNVNLKCMESIYLSAIKCLLGVRRTSPNDLCLIEAGFPSLTALVKRKQQQFFRKVYSERSGMRDDPLMFSLDLTSIYNPNLHKHVQELVSNECFVHTYNAERNNRVSLSEKTKFVLYRDINTQYKVHSVYNRRKDYIPEHYRLAFTRFRLSSHRLRIETGRWARIPRERRLCPCGSIQDERHVLVDCNLVRYIRDSYGQEVNFPGVLDYANSRQDFTYIYDVLRYYE